MTINFATFRLGADEDAVGRLINGDLPGDDERWQMLDAPRYHIERLLSEHERGQAALLRCRDELRPFALFLRSFASEAQTDREAGSYLTRLSLRSYEFQEHVAAMLKPADVAFIRLHGGSDGIYSGSSKDALILCTNERNWLAVAADLIGSARLIVFLISDMTPGVLEELALIRKLGMTRRCIVVDTVVGSPRSGEKESSRGVAAELDGFEHVLQATPEAPESAELDALLRRLLAEPTSPRGSLEHAIAAPFSYIEPSFLESEDYRVTQAQLWRSMRILRVMFDDAYWSVLDAHGVAYRHFTFPAVWRLAHRLFGLGIVTMDLRAAREALRYVELMSYLRDADYALVLPHLAQQYAVLAKRIWPQGEPDTEAEHAIGPDVSKLEVSTRTAVQLCMRAQELARGQDLDMAGCLFQAAAIIALRARDTEKAEAAWIAVNICRDWASFQMSTQPVWAKANLTLAASLMRDLARRDPDAHTASLALVLNNLGAACFHVKDVTGCDSAWTEALTLRRSAPNRDDQYLENLWTSLDNLALLRSEQVRIEEACALYDEAVLTARRMPAEKGAINRSRSLALKCQCLMRAGDRLEEAALCARQAEEALAELPPPRATEMRKMLRAALPPAVQNLTR